MRDDWEAASNLDRDGGINTAVHAWCEDPAAAKARYGPIASWDTSRVTDLDLLFSNRRDFNEDISRWNVSNVVTMHGMLQGATSFNGDLSCWDVGRVRTMDRAFAFTTSFDRQLGGAWCSSTASKEDMFYESLGSIAGKTKHADGDISVFRLPHFYEVRL
jgi:hypothetical protein